MNVNDKWCLMDMLMDVNVIISHLSTSFNQQSMDQNGASNALQGLDLCFSQGYLSFETCCPDPTQKEAPHEANRWKQLGWAMLRLTFAPSQRTNSFDLASDLFQQKRTDVRSDATCHYDRSSMKPCMSLLSQVNIMQSPWQDQHPGCAAMFPWAPYTLTPEPKLHWQSPEGCCFFFCACRSERDSPKT